MRRTLIRAAAICLASLFATGAALAQAPAAAPLQEQKQVLKETHGDWEIHCLEGTETCAMQQVGNTTDGERALLVTVQRLAGVTAEGKEVPAAITVSTPLGILIPYGIRVRVDEGNIAQVPLLRCLAENCVGRAPMAADAITELKRGGTAIFAFFLQDEILAEVSLNGFTAAYDALKPVVATQN